MDRVKYWIDDLHTAEQSGELPRFTIMSLGENHTKGTSPGAHTPEACVGSNDLGLGRIVEAATHSKFWNEMAIFVIEDDAQNGPDHVDAHRTAGLVISPYCRRGAGGQHALHDGQHGAHDRTDPRPAPADAIRCRCHADVQLLPSPREVMPYAALMPQVDLAAKNTRRSPYAAQSERMNFQALRPRPRRRVEPHPVALAKGPNVPYPTPIHRALFTTAPQ